MTGTKLAQHVKKQDRSNMFKNNLKSATASFSAPHTHQNHEIHTVVLTRFFEIMLLPKSDSFRRAEIRLAADF